KCGTFGLYAGLSFNGNKTITTSGGGALVCPSEEAAKRVMFFATQARDNAPHYQHTHIGYNYRMSNICAGIGRGQMTVVNEFIARRRAIHNIYKTELADVKGITVFDNPTSDFNSNHWLTCIIIDKKTTGFDREDLRLAMDKANIETRPLWKPMHLQPVFADAPSYVDGTSEDLFDNGLCLPSGASLNDDDILRVINVIKNLK
ncbi:MAG: DegT/DnrJ/EryC1/StrS family aminotransferase, partial [Rikenellaceae bacterium]